MLARNSRVSFSRASRASMVDAASERRSRVSAIFQRAVGRLREEQVAEEQLNATWDEERGHQIMQQRQRTGDEVLYRYRASRASAAAAEPTPPPQPAAKAPSLLRTVTSFMLSSRNKAEAAPAVRARALPGSGGSGGGGSFGGSGGDWGGDGGDWGGCGDWGGDGGD